MSEGDSTSWWERQPADKREWLLDQFAAEIWEEFRQAFPVGAAVRVTTDQTFGVVVDGRNETERASRIIGYATDALDVPRPIILSPPEVVELISVALYDDPRALTLGS
jgi:hypothetical protein